MNIPKFKTVYLLSYESPKFFVLSDWVIYDLTTEVKYFWGLFTRIERIGFKIYDNQISKPYFDHWDMLIKEHRPIE